MFWIIAFIIIVGMIVEGANSKYKDLKKDRHEDQKKQENLKRILKEINGLTNDSSKTKSNKEPIKLAVAENNELNEPGINPANPVNPVNSAIAVSTARKPSYEPELDQKPSSDLVKEFERWGIRSLWHMTHIQNIPSIVGAGLLPHEAPRLVTFPPNSTP